MPMLQENRREEISTTLSGADVEQRQRRRMLVALLVLFVALILVLIKDREFWFPGSTAEPEVAEPVAPAISVAPKTPVAAIPQKPAPPPTPAHTHPRSRRVAVKAPVETPTQEVTTPPVVAATNRAVLPPLEVEVVAGDQHQTLNSGSNSVNVELQSGTSSFGREPAPLQNQDNTAQASGQRVQLSPGTAQVLSRPVSPNYPLLAKQMKVQGAVVLQALIDRNGSIQDIQVLSGPAILSAAAREAVRQWRFKPYYQSGHAVETEARITVNFTISTY